MFNSIKTIVLISVIALFVASCCCMTGASTSQKCAKCAEKCECTDCKCESKADCKCVKCDCKKCDCKNGKCEKCKCTECDKSKEKPCSKCPPKK